MQRPGLPVGAGSDINSGFIWQISVIASFLVMTGGVLGLDAPEFICKNMLRGKINTVHCEERSNLWTVLSKTGVYIGAYTRWTTGNGIK